MQDNTKKRICPFLMALCVALGVISLVAFIPQVRESIIDFGEGCVGRPLQRQVWHERLIDYGAALLALSFAGYFCLKASLFCIESNTSLYGLFKTMPLEEIFHYFSLMAFIIILCAIHFCLAPFKDDVNYFNHALDGVSYFEFLNLRYNNWSSRLLIETALVNCFKFNFGLWRLIDVAAFVLISECFVKLCIPKKQFSFVVYAVILFFTDYSSLQSAGWAATTANYLWPLACCMPYFVIVKKIFEGQRLSAKSIVFSIVLLMFAVNQEQVAALVFGLSLSFFAIYFIRTKNNRIYALYFIAAFALSLASVIFILTCPGDSIRFAQEVKVWFPEYTTLSFFDKLQIGSLAVFTYYFSSKSNLVAALLCAVLTMVFYKKNRINFFIQILLDFFVFACSVLKYKSSFLLSNDRLAQLSEHSTIAVFAEFVLLFFIGIAFLYQLFFAFGGKEAGAFNLYLLFAFFCSAIIIAFSPTVYASGSRCYLFLSYFVFYLTVKLIFQSYERGRKHE